MKQKQFRCWTAASNDPDHGVTIAEYTPIRAAEKFAEQFYQRTGNNPELVRVGEYQKQPHEFEILCEQQPVFVAVPRKLGKKGN